MIDAHDLRIGNWLNVVKHISKSGNYQINGLDISDIWQGHGYVFDPIPITPAILIACGFKNIQGDFYIKDSDLMLSLDDCWWWTNSWEADGEFGFNALATYKEIQSLHQLQNLFYCLTGREIEYNPDKK